MQYAAKNRQRIGDGIPKSYAQICAKVELKKRKKKERYAKEFTKPKGPMKDAMIRIWKYVTRGHEPYSNLHPSLKLLPPFFLDVMAAITVGGIVLNLIIWAWSLL